MTVEFTFRILGMVVFVILGARFGVSTADFFNLPADANGLIFSLVGALFGLIGTPWITTRPATTLRRRLLESPAEMLAASLIGLIFGLLIALLLTWPLSLLPDLFGQYMPIIIALVCAYFGVVIFSARAYDLAMILNNLIGARNARNELSYAAAGGVLLDTSVVIDGRILDMSKTGFIYGTVYVTQFVLSELNNIAGSSDPLRRQRGRHGLEILNRLKQEGRNTVQIIDDDPTNIEAVDEKLVAVAQERGLPLMTNDFNLNKITEVQGVQVLNINELSLALQPILLPGEELLIWIIAEGREPNQGVGYLKDGTMVVVEDGRRYLDRRINVIITRYIRSSAGKMYFARPSDDIR